MNFETLYKEAQFPGAKRLIDRRYRFYWMVSFIFLFCCSGAVVYVTINRYFQDPTYNVNLDSTSSKTQFPSVQICPEVNYPIDKMNQFVESVKYPSSINASYTRSVLKQLAAFSSPDVAFHIKDLENLQNLLDFNDLNIEEVTKNLTASCEEILLKCRWVGKIVNCSSIFQFEITRTGYCCVFNGRSLKREMAGDISKKDAYMNDLSYDFDNSLMFAVEQRENSHNLDLDYKWLNIQTGQHYVDMNENGTVVSPGVEWRIRYRTKTLQVSPAVISLNYDLRGCRLTQEPLKYFPIYHKNLDLRKWSNLTVGVSVGRSIVARNDVILVISSQIVRRTHCLLECEIDRTMKRCECLKLSHPRLFGMPLCRASHLICARQATVSYAIEECNCLPSCNVDLHYSVPESFNLIAKSYTVDSFYNELNLERATVIRVIVEKHRKKIFERRSYFFWLNLFSQLGGIFNVFLGCSVLTLLEIMQLGWRALNK